MSNLAALMKNLRRSNPIFKKTLQLYAPGKPSVLQLILFNTKLIKKTQVCGQISHIFNTSHRNDNKKIKLEKKIVKKF